MENYVVKIIGKTEIPEPLLLGTNYLISVNADITTITREDNHDGTETLYFRARPQTCEILKSNGEVIKGKDTNSRSKQLRMLLWKRWREQDTPISFEDYYDKEMVKIMQTI
jgi:hypothetical protein